MTAAWRFPHARLLVFAKAPRPGTVKTRLHSAIGVDGAVRLHKQLVQWRVRSLASLSFCPVELWCSPDVGDPLFSALASELGIERCLQQGVDLGARMHHALDIVSNRADQVVLLGTDCPTLGADQIVAALTALQAGMDAVVTPAEDGGYGLIGVRRSDRRLFNGVEWGGSRVMAQTRQRLKRIGWQWCETTPCWDVDRPSDLQRLRMLKGFAWLSAGKEGMPGRRGTDPAPYG